MPSPVAGSGGEAAGDPLDFSSPTASLLGCMASLQTAKEVASQKHCCRSRRTLLGILSAAWLRFSVVTAQELLRAANRRRRFIQRKVDRRCRPISLSRGPPRKADWYQFPGDERLKRE